MDTRIPESRPSEAAAPRSDSGPAVLAELIAAGLVSHEMIADPARLGGEAEALRLLCGLVAGPVWRIEPWHYAFRADPGGVPPARAAELEAALAAELGEGAVWVLSFYRREDRAKATTRSVHTPASLAAAPSPFGRV